MKTAILFLIFNICCILGYSQEYGKTRFEWFNNVSKNGDLIAISKDNKLRVFNTEDGSEFLQFDAPKPILGFAFSNDSKSLSLMDAEYTFYGFDLESRELKWSSELREAIDLPVEQPKPADKSFNIGFDFPGNRVFGLSISKGEVGSFERNVAIGFVLDAHTGDFIGFSDQKKSKGPQQADRIGSLVFGNKEEVMAFEPGYSGYQYVYCSEMFDYFDMATGKAKGSTISAEYLKEFLIDEDGDPFRLVFEDKKFKDNWVLRYRYRDYAVRFKKGKDTDPFIKVSSDSKHFIVIRDGEAEQFKIDIKGKNDDNLKPFNSYDLDLGGMAPIYLNDKHLITADLDKNVFTVYDISNGKQKGKYDVSESFKYIGIAKAKDWKNAGPGVYFTEAFQDNQNRWELRDSHENFVGKIDGTLKLRKGNGVIMATNDQIGANLFQDFQIIAKMKGTGGTYGLYWGHEIRTGYKKFLMLTADGTCSIGTMNIDNEILGTALTKQVTVKSEDANELKVWYRDGGYVISVNEQVLDVAGLAGPHGTGLGFIYNGQADVEVTQLMLAYMSDRTNFSSTFLNEEFDGKEAAIELEHSGYLDDQGHLEVMNNNDKRMWIGINGLRVDARYNYAIEMMVKVEGGHAGFNISDKGHSYLGRVFAANADGEYESSEFDLNQGNWERGTANKWEQEGWNTITFVYIDGTHHFLVNGESVDSYKSKYHRQSDREAKMSYALYLEGNSQVLIDRISASYLHPEQSKPKRNACQIYIAYRRDTGAATNPIACKYNPIAYGDHKLHFEYMRENNITMEKFNSLQEFKQAWGSSPKLGTLKNVFVCDGPCH